MFRSSLAWMPLLLLAISSGSAQSMPKVLGGNLPLSITCQCQEPDTTVDDLKPVSYESEDLTDILNGPGYYGVKRATGFKYGAGMANWTMEYEPIVKGVHYKTLTINWAISESGIVDWGEMYSTVVQSRPAPIYSEVVNDHCNAY